MDPWRKKLKLWKLNLLHKFPFLRMFPYCILAFLLLISSVSIIRNGYFTRKSGFLFDLAPGEVVPTKNLVKEPQTSYYEVVFKRLFDEGYISRSSKALSIDSTNGQDVLALKKIGVADVTGITEMPSAKFIVSGQGISHPFEDQTFDFEFFGYNTRFKYWTEFPAHTASEIGRTVKAGGYLAIHLVVDDEYSYNSFINLFPCCSLISSRLVRSLEYSIPLVHEFVFKKEVFSKLHECMTPDVKRKIIHDLEPLERRQRGWEGPRGNENITLKYLPSMVDLSFKERYIYVDIGANSYESSIGTWFDKEYPKQNKPFEIYAIEADKAFHEEYKGITGLTLLPYAAWVRNETLTFEVYKVPPDYGVSADRMGFIRDLEETNKDDLVTLVPVEAFDFTEWLIRTVTKRDYVVVKMDVEGAEFQLLKRMNESGALCLIDELFLECHHSDPFGESGTKFNVPFSQCLDVFKNLRKDGCIVHQWW